jgi:hypothetical protein
MALAHRNGSISRARPEPPCPRKQAEGTSSVPGLLKNRAEDLLDWLEAHGKQGWLSRDEAEKGWVVEYRRLVE